MSMRTMVSQKSAKADAKQNSKKIYKCQKYSLNQILDSFNIDSNLRNRTINIPKTKKPFSLSALFPNTKIAFFLQTGKKFPQIKRIKEAGYHLITLSPSQAALIQKKLPSYQAEIGFWRILDSLTRESSPSHLKLTLRSLLTAQPPLTTPELSLPAAA